MSQVPAIVYLAHPVRATTKTGMEQNLANARLWLEHLVIATDWAVCVSWMPYVEALLESVHRERGLRDDLAILSRCDAIVLVGGRMTHGMQIERDHAETCGLAVVDLLEHGPTPPLQTPAYPNLMPVVPDLTRIVG